MTTFLLFLEGWRASVSFTSRQVFVLIPPLISPAPPQEYFTVGTAAQRTQINPISHFPLITETYLPDFYCNK